MCNANDVTYNGDRGKVGGYTLSAEDAAALRVPMIDYPEKKVPVEVAQACFMGGCDSSAVKQEGGMMLLPDALAYLDSISRGQKAVCEDCPRKGEQEGCPPYGTGH